MKPTYFRPTPGYNVTFEEDLGVLKIERTSLLDKTFFLVNDDLLQQLYPPLIITQFNDDSNDGIQPWTLNRSETKSAMSLLGLGPNSSKKCDAERPHQSWGRLGKHASHRGPRLAREPLHLFTFPHANQLQSIRASRQQILPRSRRRQQWLRQHFDPSAQRARLGLCSMRGRYIANH